MSHAFLKRRGWVSLGLLAVGLLGLPSAAAAQTASEAKAVQATLLSLLGPSTTVLAGTGAIPDGSTGALQASSVTGTVPSLLAGDSLHAVTIASPGEASSEASLGSLGIAVAGNTISADFIIARAQAISGSGGAGSSEIDGLSINGLTVPVSGAANQTVPIVGGVVILNEQQTGAGGAVVNALHIIVTGVADVILASATAAAP
ncbi:MAG TPA: choice-of-anchor P family protein [Candidatus Dormibacteraeota bacterium]|nr:choice-of-anchor P family protein [Candidatus Dormibacteraeota bacterium]